MMMKRSNERPIYRAVVFFLGLVMVFSACKKPEDNIGLEALDPADALGVIWTDTSSVVTYSMLDDSVRTSSLSRNMIGSFNDPAFGTVNTSTYVQLRLSTNNVGEGILPTDLQLDSLVLSLAYDFDDPYYGNLQEQELVVFELAEDMIPDTAYYSKDVIGVIPSDIIKVKKNRFVPDPVSPVVVDGDTLLPQMRIRLTDDLGRRFLDQWGSVNLESNDEFLQFFKGLHILTNNGVQSPNEGAALHFDMLDANTKATLYYRDNTSGTEDTLAYDFDIDDKSARFTRVEQYYDQALWPIVEQHLADISTGQELFFLQSGGGLRGVINFPYLMEHNDTIRKAVSKAELVIPVKEPFNAAWYPPTSLFVFRKTDSGTDAFLPDQFEQFNGIGGVFDEDNREYRFNITRYIQQVLNGTLENTGINIVAGNRGVSVARAELMGQENLDRSAKLILTFTEL